MWLQRSLSHLTRTTKVKERNTSNQQRAAAQCISSGATKEFKVHQLNNNGPAIAILRNKFRTQSKPNDALDFSKAFDTMAHQKLLRDMLKLKPDESKTSGEKVEPFYRPYSFQTTSTSARFSRRLSENTFWAILRGHWLSWKICSKADRRNSYVNLISNPSLFFLRCGQEEVIPDKYYIIVTLKSLSAQESSASRWINYTHYVKNIECALWLWNISEIILTKPRWWERSHDSVGTREWSFCMNYWILLEVS